MDIAAFRASLDAAEPPPALSQALRALWLDARGNWDGAHDPRRRTRAGQGTGCTPICIARRATPATPPTGIGARASRSAKRRSTKNGRRSPSALLKGES